ncbi:hypothetical protein Poli38472_004508 [Pythium oligandrum]|uniref:Uncharacterized protein n=1 Tax=Pythium oligandrum TaxID=41045 RepID=A0A8K1C9Y8_PYTOL|nr:hypothetical protein Poli38472_004508 [Pythium oligandrum]|eukprot:TMW59439.1 hypothetical protein Poli38472_004508 [Pythium oligandrum]
MFAYPQRVITKASPQYSVGFTARASPSSPPSSPPSPPSSPTYCLSAVVIAWENVLFPLKWLTESAEFSLTQQGIEATKLKTRGNPFLAQALGAIEQQIIGTLSIIAPKVPVYIVTESCTEAVEAICATFFPGLRAYLGSTRGRVQVLPAVGKSQVEQMTSKLNQLQQICVASAATMEANKTQTPFKILTITADEIDRRVTTRMQQTMARFGAIQTMHLPALMANGKPLSLVDFHKQLQKVAAALAKEVA